MRVPLSWLREYCAPALDAAALASRLALTGTEVERVEHHGVGETENFVVGRVLERRHHPDADRLTVCMVDVGGSTPTQIVCGAPNVAAGQMVAVARPGAIMPGGASLDKTKLRGVLSDGMILAEDELALGTEHDGILVLDTDAAPGSRLEEILSIATDVLVLEITPNRPDCLGIYGIAREVHAATGAPLSPAPWTTDPGTNGILDGITIEVRTSPERCPRFTARAFENVSVGPSPLWLKARLMAAGQRPISNVVDITNYVMLLSGQPLHAFDLDRVAGSRLIVRDAGADEEMLTLDDQSRRLRDGMVVIEDADGPTSIAGVMGSARSEVSAGTSRVLMEAATWNGANIHRTSLALGLRSEASARFEKGLAPEQAMEAQALATRLMIDLCGAELRPGTVDLGGPGAQPPTIRLRDARLRGLLGVEVPRSRTTEVLSALEFAVSAAPDGLDVTPPAFRRADVTREADVIEEVARLAALEDLPATLPSRHGAAGHLTGRQRQRRDAADALTAHGLHEVVGWSFTSAAQDQRLGLTDQPAVRLANPMSAESSQLRTTLLGSLLDIARRNQAHGEESVRIFEQGAVYLPREPGELPDEPHHIAALLIGPLSAPTWRHPAPQTADFFVAKGVLAALLDRLGAAFAVEPSREAFLHPGRASRILLDGVRVGWLGELHPRTAAEYELRGAPCAFELDLDLVAGRGTAAYRDLTSFPPLREDLAVVVPDTVAAAEVLQTVRHAGGELLVDAHVFDVYRDTARLGEDRVSLALALRYRSAEKTLTAGDVAALRDAITTALADEHGGVLRDA